MTIRTRPTIRIWPDHEYLAFLIAMGCVEALVFVVKYSWCIHYWF